MVIVLSLLVQRIAIEHGIVAAHGAYKPQIAT